MVLSETQYLFRETRLNLEPPTPASVVTIRVPSNASGGRAQRKLTQDASGEEEVVFRLKNLATNATVYHRKWHDAPKGFLWRVLNDGLLLSLRTVDICRNDKAFDTPLVLNFNFTVPIQPGCVALSDPKEHDALCVFVLDQANQLYTFTLRPDLFKKRSAVDAGLSDLCKVETPAGLSFKHAHRLVAVSASTLVVTVNDGGLIRLDRTRNDGTSQQRWQETFFNAQGWKQNLRSLLPFQGHHTIKYGKVNMEYSAPTSIEITDFGVENALFAVTVCLDHRMRVWNLADGQILHTRDLLDVERQPQEVGKWCIDPSQSNLLQIVDSGLGQRIIATFSPVGQGEFKFWKAVARNGTVTAEDIFPGLSLVPNPPSSSDVWTLADFKLSSPGARTLNLWTLWKNNMSYRAQRLELDRERMKECWETGWDGVYADTGYELAMASGPCDPTDVTEKWLQHILQPGRFSKATLETALSIYERTLGVTKDVSKGRSMAESICSVLGSTATLDKSSSPEMAYEQFRASSESQWRRFYRLVIEFDKQRGEALGLVVDPNNDLTFVVCADLLSVVRECSPLERIYHNVNIPEEGADRQVALINSALAFVDGFSDSFLHLSNAVLRSEIYGNSPKTAMERIQYFSDKAGFWRGITEEECAQVTDALGQNFATVTDELYGEILDLFAGPLDKPKDVQLPLTEFGRKLANMATQETIELQWKVAFSQLILLVHMEFEFDNEEDALSRRIDIGHVYGRLVAILRKLELNRWLANTTLSTSISERAQAGAKSPEDVRSITALEAFVGRLLGFSDTKDVSMALKITDLVGDLCAPDSDIEVSPAYIQCALVKRERADLAQELAPFCDEDPFSVYVQGRVFLAMKQFDAAAWNFKRAAFGMSTKSVQIERHSGGLLDETEWNLINHGQTRYYSHIVALYERYRAYFHVIEFARLAAQFVSSEEGIEETKTDMQSRLFNAAVATAQFEVAHTSLQHFKDHALRQSGLKKLVDKMCETGHNLDLISLPFPGMQQDVEDILADRCRATMDVLETQYHQVLYSWRIKRSNFRGAASVLLDRIQKLRLAGEGDKLTGEDTLDTPVTRQYLLLINALSCVDPQQAWIFDEGGSSSAKRKVVSLEDVRKQYQDEMDRITAIQNNQFGFGADDVMEIA